VPVPFNYLSEQFPVDGDIAEPTDSILHQIRKVVERGDFTLGKEVGDLETEWAKYCGTAEAVGVASGTDALVMALRAVGIRRDERVIVPAYTFPSTFNAIAEAGGSPVLVDVDSRGILDWSKAAAMAEEYDIRITVPVWWAGLFPGIPDDWNGVVVEDACQAIGARSPDGSRAGSVGDAGAFSLHPLKNVNVWGDGGMVVTHSKTMAEWIRVARNNGIENRDDWTMRGYNSRLDTIQAVVAQHMLPFADQANAVRRHHARFLDQHLDLLPEITVPVRKTGEQPAFHLYQVFAKRRDDLVEYLNAHGVEAKVHYPKPFFLEPALDGFKQPGGKMHFPGALRFANDSVTLPCHQYLTSEQLAETFEHVGNFYKGA
jgi:aminotransferase EvaB